MTKQSKRWPIWKIAVVTAGFTAVAVVLFWLSAHLERSVGGLATQPTGQSPVLTPGSFIMMGAIVVAAFALFGAGWLIYRIREACRPAWERGRGKKRR
jgi:hypothetical protein